MIRLAFDLDAAVERIRRRWEARIERLSRALVSAELASCPRRPPPALATSIHAATYALAGMSAEDAALAVALIRAVPEAPATDPRN